MVSVMAIEKDVFVSLFEQINLSLGIENKNLLSWLNILGISFCSKSGSRLLVEVRDN